MHHHDRTTISDTGPFGSAGPRLSKTDGNAGAAADATAVTGAGADDSIPPRQVKAGTLTELVPL